MLWFKKRRSPLEDLSDEELAGRLQGALAAYDRMSDEVRSSSWLLRRFPTFYRAWLHWLGSPNARVRDITGKAAIFDGTTFVRPRFFASEQAIEMYDRLCEIEDLTQEAKHRVDARNGSK